jgi:plasmid stability protein
MQKPRAGAFYLELPTDMMRQLRLSAARHGGRAAGAEAVAILGDALGTGPIADSAGAEYRMGTGLRLELPECLVARLRPLADRDHRTVAGEAAFLLQILLRQRLRVGAADAQAPPKSRGRPRQGE